MSLRLALGATRARAIQFHIAEAVVLGVIGGALGLALAYLGTDAILAMSPRSFPLVNELGIDTRVLGFTLLISLMALPNSGPYSRPSYLPCFSPRRRLSHTPRPSMGS